MKKISKWLSRHFRFLSMREKVLIGVFLAVFLISGTLALLGVFGGRFDIRAIFSGPTPIANKATVAYTDSRGGAKSVDSNLVQMFVDSRAPYGTVTLNPGSSDQSNYSPITTVNITAGDLDNPVPGSGVAQMQLSIDDMTFTKSTGWIAYAPTVANWNMTNANYGGNSSPGYKILYIRFKDNAGNISLNASARYTYNIAPDAI